jgi:hypothetical protein
MANLFLTVECASDMEVANLMVINFVGTTEVSKLLIIINFVGSPEVSKLMIIVMQVTWKWQF